jgi:hypothetical protein
MTDALGRTPLSLGRAAASAASQTRRGQAAASTARKAAIFPSFSFGQIGQGPVLDAAAVAMVLA